MTRRNEGTALQEEPRAAVPQRVSQLLGGDDNDDDPLTREILGLIRPAQNNASGGATQTAEGLFSNLRQQLDSLQTQVNDHGPAVEDDDLHSGNSNMGWRERAMVNHGREIQHLNSAQANPRLSGHGRANRR